MNNLYLERYAWPERLFPEFHPQNDLELIVVIPAYHEKDLLHSLLSLGKCEHTDNILVMVIINEAEDEQESHSAINQQSLHAIEQNKFPFPVLSKIIKLPAKKAGVGLARKVGMDEAVRIFESLRKDGIIVCYDADCTCESNYIQAIKDFYDQPNNVGLVYYEHSLLGENLEAIINYELYLRYYVDALRWAGFPFAFQTLGSCITVKSRAYQKQGGMNTRKAGEDFYFIHKMTPLGKIGEINETCIYPSDRVSDRVPFGTGQAIDKYLQENPDTYEVYNPRIFGEMKQFLEASAWFFDCDSITDMVLTDKCRHFLEECAFEEAFTKMKKNSSNYSNFRARFFAWFDGFRALKFVHFMRDQYYPNIDILVALGWLQHEYLHLDDFNGSKEKKLVALRAHDRAQDFFI